MEIVLLVNAALGAWLLFLVMMYKRQLHKDLKERMDTYTLNMEDFYAEELDELAEHRHRYSREQDETL